MKEEAQPDLLKDLECDSCEDLLGTERIGRITGCPFKYDQLSIRKTGGSSRFYPLFTFKFVNTDKVTV